ncbi:MAG: hypothetical protein FJ403_20245 [Verrucomicrobia bacterium]|nr:hypothetical protein [Verrucomicrobiota bacterium]
MRQISGIVILRAELSPAFREQGGKEGNDAAGKGIVARARHAGCLRVFVATLTSKTGSLLPLRAEKPLSRVASGVVSIHYSFDEPIE